MKRKWDNHELIEHWTVEREERDLIFNKRGANRLGFALLLKFFHLNGYAFLRKRMRFLGLCRPLSPSSSDWMQVITRSTNGKEEPSNIIELKFVSGSAFVE